MYTLDNGNDEFGSNVMKYVGDYMYYDTYSLLFIEQVQQILIYVQFSIVHYKIHIVRMK